jgi:fructokinase
MISAPHSTRTVLGIGELVWDLLPGGERLGGAPFNVVAHLRRFGCRAVYVSAVGTDARGRRAIEAAARVGVDTSLIEVNGRPTGVVRVRLGVAGEPEYEIVSPAAYEAASIHENWAGVVADSVDLVVFGTLAQRFPSVHAATERLISEAGDAVRLYDVNLRRGCWDRLLVEDLVQLATVLKLNEDEQSILAAELALPASSVEAFARSTSARYGLRGVCVTRGSSGAALLLDGTYLEAPAPNVDVIDTVGAGDAFAAGLAMGLMEGWSVTETLAICNRLGSLVVGHSGAIPRWARGEIEPPAGVGR